jgi:SulP family sulfate permease
MTGFVNALAILVFLAQLPELDPRQVTWLTCAMVAAGVAIIYLFPRITKAIPSPLVMACIRCAERGWQRPPATCRRLTTSSLEG